MDFGKEFEKYAIKHHGISSTYYSGLITNMTPNIIEERQLNAVAMDVFSRLMMDRIIFLGTGINDQVANIIQAQLLFLENCAHSFCMNCLGELCQEKIKSKKVSEIACWTCNSLLLQQEIRHILR